MSSAELVSMPALQSTTYLPAALLPHAPKRNAQPRRMHVRVRDLRRIERYRVVVLKNEEHVRMYPARKFSNKSDKPDLKPKPKFRMKGLLSKYTDSTTLSAEAVAFRHQGRA